MSEHHDYPQKQKQKQQKLHEKDEMLNSKMKERLINLHEAMKT